MIIVILVSPKDQIIGRTHASISGGRWRDSKIYIEIYENRFPRDTCAPCDDTPKEIYRFKSIAVHPRSPLPCVCLDIIQESLNLRMIFGFSEIDSALVYRRQEITTVCFRIKSVNLHFCANGNRSEEPFGSIQDLLQIIQAFTSCVHPSLIRIIGCPFALDKQNLALDKLASAIIEGSNSFDLNDADIWCAVVGETGAFEAVPPAFTGWEST